MTLKGIIQFRFDDPPYKLPDPLKEPQSLKIENYPVKPLKADFTEFQKSIKNNRKSIPQGVKPSLKKNMKMKTCLNIFLKKNRNQSNRFR